MGSKKGSTKSPITRERIRQGMLGKRNGLGHRMTEENKRKFLEASHARKGTLTPEQRRKIGSYHIGNQYCKGRKHTIEERAKMKGRKRTLEQCKRISEAHKGQRPWMKGKKHTLRAKEQNRIAHIGKKQTPQQIEAMHRALARLEVKQKMREKRLKQIMPIEDTKPEKLMQSILEQLNITFIKHKVTSIPHAYQCDLYLPRQNTIIEVDGKYWHNYPYGNPIDHKRTKELRAKGYKVLRFWEGMFDEQIVFTKLFLDGESCHS